MKKLYALLLPILLTACSSNSSYVKDLPDNEMLLASLEARQLDTEADYMFGICNTIASYDAEKDTTEMLNTDHLTSEYYRNVHAFNSKNSDFFDTYRRSYIDTEEQTQALMDAIENIHDKPTIDNIAKRFGVKNVVGDESQSPMTSVSNIMAGIRDNDINYEKHCRNFYDEVLEDDYFPDFDKYGKEYQLISGMKSIN